MSIILFTKFYSNSIVLKLEHYEWMNEYYEW